MFWIMIMVIVLASLGGDAYHRSLKYKEKTLKIQQEILQKQLELEQLKQQNFIAETEKLRLELQTDLKQSPSKQQLLEGEKSITLEK